MEWYADFHVHSRYSIATGQQADLAHFDLWGRYKGLAVVGTGDCLHPGWLRELTAQLAPAGEGVYELKPAFRLPSAVTGSKWEALPPVRFVITGEVSAIYRKGGRVRKIHLLLLLSGLEAACALSDRLGRLGNVTADGRPILGLDARQILELTLETDPEALVIPAHIWTPWFSVLGAKSGFESLEECFEDQVRHIYALETGLSSDPAMNWRVRALDPFVLVSNSDAHSPQKLGREANLFSVPPTFPAMARALRTRQGFEGTIEFFPEEGKYHLDGHRKCGLRCHPEETRAQGGRCPICGRPLTLGVLHRVVDLADRPPGVPAPGSKPFYSLISLTSILAEVLQSPPGGRKVESAYFRLLEKLGPELGILRHTPEEELAREGGELLALAVAKMRRGEVRISAGYDGLYGEISLLSPEDRRQCRGQGALWVLDPRPAEPPRPVLQAVSEATPAAAPSAASSPSAPGQGEDPLLAGLNELQRRVVTFEGPALLVQAGPGTGKTRALTHRLAYLLERRQVAPERLLALTFTRKAAEEMRQRLQRLLPEFSAWERLFLGTFHALGLRLLRERGETREVADEERRRSFLKKLARDFGLPLPWLDRYVCLAKQNLEGPGEAKISGAAAFAEAYAAYEALLGREGLWDYEDLLARPLRLFLQEPEWRESYQTRIQHLLVDEYQDLNEAQYRLVRLLAGPESQILVIGDPNQAIYGFRGAKPEYFGRFPADWPGAEIIRFHETYRLPPPLLAASRRLLPDGGGPELTHVPGTQPVVLLEAANPQAEARAIARQIEMLVGGLDSMSLEEDRLRYQDGDLTVGFQDIAVLFRLHAQGPELLEALTAAGIPCELAREEVGPDITGIDLQAQKVKLLTLHAAKGLEFPYVFIAGCETGLLPLEPEGREPADPEEERRLFYVGLTRARQQVFLTRARWRVLRGQSRSTSLSPLAAVLEPQKISPSARPGRGSGQKSLFPELRPPVKARGRQRIRGS